MSQSNLLSDVSKEENKKQACGNEDCSVSTFIDEETWTFGSGQLDHHGVWEHPCKACAQEFLKTHPNVKTIPYVGDNS